MKLFVLSVLVFPIICTAQPEQFTRSTMTVMAWNLAGFERIPRERVPNLVPAVRDMDAEVLALVEVNTDWVPAELAAELNDLGVWVFVTSVRLLTNQQVKTLPSYTSAA